MAEIIRASTVVDFGAEESEDELSPILNIQVDSRSAEDGGLNNGQSQFFPGEPVHLLLYESSALTGVVVRATNGSITSVATGVTEVDEVLTFSESDRASLPYPVDGGTTFSWLGTVYGPSDTSVSANLSLLGDSTVRVTNGAKVQGLLRVQYSSNFRVYRLNGTSHTKVMVYAKGVIP